MLKRAFIYYTITAIITVLLVFGNVAEPELEPKLNNFGSATLVFAIVIIRQTNDLHIIIYFNKRLIIGTDTEVIVTIVFI